MEDSSQPPPPQPYLTPEQVARLLRVDATTVRRWIREGSLIAETARVGRRTYHRIARSAIDALQRQGEQE